MGRYQGRRYLLAWHGSGLGSHLRAGPLYGPVRPSRGCMGLTQSSQSVRRPTTDIIDDITFPTPSAEIFNSTSRHTNSSYRRHPQCHPKDSNAAQLSAAHVSLQGEVLRARHTDGLPAQRTGVWSHHWLSLRYEVAFARNPHKRD